MRRLAKWLVLAVGLATPATAFDIAAMDEGDRAAFGAAVREYLIENPEVLMEAIAVLEARQQAAQAEAEVAALAANREALEDDGRSWVGGNPDGDVTLVEFVDYRCGFCRRAHPEVEELVASDGDIRLVIKEYPILGEDSVTSSRFAIAARIVGGDDAYKAVHDALIGLRGAPSEPALRRIAEDAGLDADAVLGAMSLPAVVQEIAENRALAQALQITGTPTFVLGDRLLRGYVPLDGMRQLVAEERAEG
ncbi:MAG: DsbA family protein [Shimia sp.]